MPEFAIQTIENAPHAIPLHNSFESCGDMIAEHVIIIYCYHFHLILEDTQSRKNSRKVQNVGK